MMRLSLCAALSLLLVTACNAEPNTAEQTSAATSSSSYKEGVNYKIAKPAGKVTQAEVTEFFSYGCPHCFEVEPAVHAWHQATPKVKLNRIAVVGFRPEWDLLAKAYYTAEVLGITEKMHLALFERVHKEKRLLANDQELAQFLSGFGVSEQQVLGTVNSFAVNTLMNSASQKQSEFRISGVPAFIVNDKYFTDVTMMGGNAGVAPVLNYLSAK